MAFIVGYEIYDAKTNKNFGYEGIKEWNSYSTSDIYNEYALELKFFSFPYYDGQESNNRKILSLEDGYIYENADDSWNDNPGYYIKDLDGNILKDISEGGIKEIEYYDGRFYVITNTEYWYVMDKNFNYILEPEKARFSDFEEQYAVLESRYHTYFTKNYIFRAERHEGYKPEDYYYDIGVYDKDTLKPVLWNNTTTSGDRVYYRLYKNANDKGPVIVANDYGVAVNLNDGSASVLLDNKEYTYENCEISLLENSNKIMQIYQKDSDYEVEGNYEKGRYNEDPIFINLETRKRDCVT